MYVIREIAFASSATRPIETHMCTDAIKITRLQPLNEAIKNIRLTTLSEFRTNHISIEKTRRLIVIDTNFTREDSRAIRAISFRRSGVC